MQVKNVKKYQKRNKFRLDQKSQDIDSKGNMKNKKKSLTAKAYRKKKN